MGGSSAPPGDLERKFGKSKRQVLNLERRQRFMEIRQDLLKLKECCVRWEQSPLFSREQTMTFINRLERLAHAKNEPDAHRRLELEDTLINRLMPLAGELRRHGATPRALTLYQRLYEGYRLVYREERRRQGTAIDLFEEGLDLGSVTTKAGMLQAIDRLVQQGALERMDTQTYYHFRVAGHRLGVYLPVRLTAPRRFFSKVIQQMSPEELEQKLRQHRVRAFLPMHERFSKFMYLLFGFQAPEYTADELVILNSPLFKARFREAARHYHPDRSSEPKAVAKFWYKVYTQTWRTLQFRRRFLEDYPAAVTDNGIIEHRSINELLWPEPSSNRGLMLKP